MGFSTSQVSIPNPLTSGPFWPGGLWGWRDALAQGARPVDGQDTAARGSDAFIFFSERQNGGCPQGFCWHEEFGEGEGTLACWPEELPAAGGGCWGGQVTAQPGCPRTRCSCFRRLPLRAAMTCSPALRHPSFLQGSQPPRNSWPQCLGEPKAAGALLVRVGAKSSLFLLTRERCQRHLPGAPSGFVPSYRRGATPWCCQGHRERGCSRSPNPPPFSGQGPGEVLPFSRLHQLLLFGPVSLSPPWLGIAAWLGGAVAAAWVPREPAATQTRGPGQSHHPSGTGWRTPRGGRGEVEISRSSTQPGNPLSVCGGDTTAPQGAALGCCSGHCPVEPGPG